MSKGDIMGWVVTVAVIVAVIYVVAHVDATRTRVLNLPK